MNERIDKLFEQALEEFKAENKYATIIVPDPLKEKFAELIVRECAGIVDNKIEVSRYVHEAELLRECSTTIKLHFGVEE
jgi:hypothetical protein